MSDEDQTREFELLQELLWAYGPCGQEDAVRDICQRELTSYVERCGLIRPEI